MGEELAQALATVAAAASLRDCLHCRPVCLPCPALPCDDSNSERSCDDARTPDIPYTRFHAKTHLRARTSALGDDDNDGDNYHPSQRQTCPPPLFHHIGRLGGRVQASGTGSSHTSVPQVSLIVCDRLVYLFLRYLSRSV